MKSQGRRGAKREHAVAEIMRADGWVVYRSAGSHGNADLIAMRVGCKVRLVQVKSSVRPFEHFRPAERRELLAEAIMCYADAVLCWWPSGGTPRFIWPEDWPPLGASQQDEADYTQWVDEVAAAEEAAT